MNALYVILFACTTISEIKNQQLKSLMTSKLKHIDHHCRRTCKEARIKYELKQLHMK